MLNFTVGPVMMSDHIKEIGAEDIPYFRTDEFSNIMFENERMMKNLLQVHDNYKMVTITGSGTASMDAVVANCLTHNDKALVINGGSFGQRFCEILECYDIPFVEIELSFGQPITQNILEQYQDQDFTSLFVNLDETSSGVLYNLDLLYRFAVSNNLFFVVDAISAFLSDEIDLSRYPVDIFITGSQKALAIPPGISLILMSVDAQDRIRQHRSRCYYLNLSKALDNQKRGQTPFTPAVGIILQLNARLKEIEGLGYRCCVQKIARTAQQFRNRIQEYGFSFVCDIGDMSNAVTALKVPLNKSAIEIFTVLKNEFNIWVTPNGGSLADSVIRVGHIGDIMEQDMDELFDAFSSLKERGVL